MKAARENEIGRCTCPVCHSSRANLRLSAKQLPYIVCGTCHVQVFARSDTSDQLLRALHIKEPAPEPEHKPEPPIAAPAPAPEPEAKPAPKPAPVAKAKPSWGIGAFT